MQLNVSNDFKSSLVELIRVIEKINQSQLEKILEEIDLSDEAFKEDLEVVKRDLENW